MFASIARFRARAAFRAADTLDLLIELVTLGEYGLEYPEGTATAGAPAGAPACPGTGRSRRLSPDRSRPSPRRNPVRAPEPCRSPRNRPATGRAAELRPSPSLPEALCPPRVTISA